MFKFKFYTSQDSRNYRYTETIDNIIDFNSSENYKSICLSVCFISHDCNTQG